MTVFLCLGHCNLQMPVGLLRCNPPTRRALDKTLLDQVGFHDVFKRTALFADTGRQRFNPCRPATEMTDQAVKHPSVKFVKAKSVNCQQL